MKQAQSQPMKRASGRKASDDLSKARAAPTTQALRNVLQFVDLQRLSGFHTPQRVEQWARENGIPFKHAHGGIWTTLAAINVSLGVRPSAANEPYDPEMVI